MASNFFTMSFDTASLASIAQMYGFPSYLSSEVATALQQAGDLLTQTAQDNTWSAFQNPTGALADSIQPTMQSPYEVIIGVGVPYGHRLEAGFFGTDSLGRVYNQAAEPYLQPALDADQDQVLALVEAAAMQAWMRIGGGG